MCLVARICFEEGLHSSSRRALVAGAAWLVILQSVSTVVALAKQRGLIPLGLPYDHWRMGSMMKYFLKVFNGTLS